VAALLRDLNYESATIGARKIASIYLGGGTPSLFSVAQVARLLDGIRTAVRLSDSVEITLEANPGAIEVTRFAGFRAAGVNRVSVGVQSLRDDRLVRLGRVHSAAEARNAVAAALAADFDSVNLDLMYGLPGDGVAEGLSDLQNAIALGTPHLSWYQLTLEPHTAWERHPPAGIPDDDIVASLEGEGRALLEDAGLQRYEVSAYARVGHRCTHNLNYWRFADYIGIGAGAHSKRSLQAGAGHLRCGKQRNPQRYMTTAGTAEAIEHRENVEEPRAIALEYLMNALRLVEGTSIGHFERTAGIDAAVIAAACQQARHDGLLSVDADRLCASEQGFSRLNSILRMV
jgi:oxygen-independent coproporphyrinogen-3 oxidase